MADKNTALQQQLDGAVEVRDAHIANMSDEFSQSDMDQLAALQRMVADAKQSLTESAKPGEVVAEDGEVCFVTLIRGGKSDRQVEVPVNTSVADLVGTLNEQEGGWDTHALTFKRRVGPGTTSEVNDLSACKLGPGDHEIFVTPKVTGG
jgi:hypothetical protein